MKDERQYANKKTDKRTASLCSEQGAMNWKDRTKNGIEVGDKVCYSRQFLQNTGQLTGDVPFARGVVTKIVPLGETSLAEIDWDTPDLPARVNTANLSKVTEKGISERH
jgi:hypothetical protein